MSNDSMGSSSDGSLDVYWSLPSQPAKAVKSLCIMGQVPHGDKHLDIFKGENRTPEMMKLNPSGQVPFIAVNGMAQYKNQLKLE